MAFEVLAPKEILHLRRNMYFPAQMAMRERIIQVRELLDYYEDKPDHLRQMTNQFDAFDPTNPDYSKLSDE
jgi:hypothetical protein